MENKTKLIVGNYYRIPRAEGSYALITGRLASIENDYGVFDTMFGRKRAHVRDVIDAKAAQECTQ